MGLELVIDEDVVLDFVTYDGSGQPVDADSLPTIEIYHGATDTPIAYAPTVVYRGITGHYRVTISPTVSNGFAAGDSFHVYVLATIATVNYKTKLDWAVARAFSIDSLKTALDAALSAIQGQTDLIPADPATETTLASIKGQTDLIPADPATETSVGAVPAAVWDEMAGSHTTAGTTGEQVSRITTVEAQVQNANIASAVWDETAASHTTAGTTGEQLGSGGNPWSLLTADNVVAGSFGEAVGAIKSQTDLIPSDPATETSLGGIQAKTDLIPSDPATETTLASIKGQTDLIPSDPATETTLAAIKGQTDLIPADPATESNVSAIPPAVWDVVSADHVDSGTTGKRLADSAAAGNPWSANVADNADPGTMGELMGQTIPTGLTDVTSGLADVTSGLADVRSALPQGDGTVTVDHNSGGTDNLAYKTGSGAGIDNAIVQAFLKTDYDAGRRSAAYVAGETQTNVYGRWVRPMKLDPGAYVFIFYKQAAYGPDRKDHTVT